MPPTSGLLRVGIVCPYDWTVPGGVQAHVRDLAETLLIRGHHVSVLAPADEETPDLPEWLVPAGRALPVPFNGSVARVRMGPGVPFRTRQWIRAGDFDLVHVHEPLTPGLALAAARQQSVPVVGTFHAAAEQGFALTLASTLLSNVLERMDARIVVSAAARATLAMLADEDPDELDCIEIPNFIDVDAFSSAQPDPRLQSPGPVVAFVGRIDEPRKGLQVLIDALPQLIRRHPSVQVLVAGPGDIDHLVDVIPKRVRSHVRMLGIVDESTKRSLFASADLYIAPNLGGESFGIVLAEAMAAGTPVLASDLPAFAAVLDGGRAGRLFATGDARALATAAADLLDDHDQRRHLAHAGRERARMYDRDEVVDRILEVYRDAVGDAHEVHLQIHALARRTRIAQRAGTRRRPTM